MSAEVAIAREHIRALQTEKPNEKVKIRGAGGVKKRWTRGVEEHGTRPDEEREQGIETQGRVGCRLKKNFKLSLRGSVEIQVQRWTDRLYKPRTRSVWID